MTARRKTGPSTSIQEFRAWAREQRRAGHNVRVLSTSAVKANWRRILGQLQSGTFIFVTRRGRPSVVMLPAEWHSAHQAMLD